MLDVWMGGLPLSKLFFLKTRIDLIERDFGGESDNAPENIRD